MLVKVDDLRELYRAYAGSRDADEHEAGPLADVHGHSSRQPAKAPEPPYSRMQGSPPPIATQHLYCRGGLEVRDSLARQRPEGGGVDQIQIGAWRPGSACGLTD